MSENRKQPPPMPTWVKVFGIVFLILALLVVAKHLSGNDFHHGSHPETTESK